jgi:hypothetical protein
MERLGMSAFNTGARGRISDVNLLRAAGLSGGTWDPALPLSNLADRTFLARPTRCLTPNNLSNSQFNVALPKQSAISVVTLLFHTLSTQARWRLSFAPIGGNLANPSFTTGWMPVWQRWASSLSVAWEESDFWTGAPSGEALNLYPSHAVWVNPTGVPIPIAAQLKIEIDDATSAFFDIGAAWVGASFSPIFNFERGRQLSLEARDLIDEAASGRFFAEERVPRRSLALQWSGLSDGEARRLFDVGARQRGDNVMLFVPDADDAASMARECWPSVFAERPAPVFNLNGTNEVRAVLKEVIA